MSKEDWFRHYERLYEEREDSGGPETDEELAQRASELQVERQLERADIARDEELEAWFRVYKDNLYDEREDSGGLEIPADKDDAARLAWWFENAAKGSNYPGYYRGLRRPGDLLDRWSLEEWRAAIDKAMGQENDPTP